MAGAKPKLTPAIQDLLVQAVSLGATQRLACQYAGIGESTLYLWLSKAVTGRSPYLELLEALQKAEGRGALGWLAKIEAAANEGNWQAAAWKLERRYPEEYGRQLMQINWQLLTDDQVDRLAEGDSPQKVLGPHANGHSNTR